MPRITFNESPDYVPEEVPISTNTKWLNWVKEEFNKPHLAWLCPACGLRNFYANKHCADFKCRLEKP